MPIASLNVKAKRLASSDASAFVGPCRSLTHARTALSGCREVLGVGSVVTLGADITSLPDAHAGAGAVDTFAVASTGRYDDELLAADSTSSFDSTCSRAILPYDVDLVVLHPSRTTAVAPVATWDEVADVIVPAVVVQMIDTQITPPDSSVPDGPGDLLPAPVARMRPRSDGVVENHAMLSDQSVGRCQRMVWSMDVPVPGARHSEEWYQ